MDAKILNDITDAEKLAKGMIEKAKENFAQQIQAANKKSEELSRVELLNINQKIQRETQDAIKKADEEYKIIKQNSLKNTAQIRQTANSNMEKSAKIILKGILSKWQ